MIERREFFFLYANLSGVAELAFWHMALKLLVAPPEEPAPVEKAWAPEEPDALAPTVFQDLDFSALEEIEIDTSAPRERPFLEQSAVEQPEAYNEQLDVERYLTRAYASEEELRERIDGYYQKADLPALEAGLGELPSQMPKLTKPMSADDMERWLERYADGDLALTELTVVIRRLSNEPLPSSERSE